MHDKFIEVNLKLKSLEVHRDCEELRHNIEILWKQLYEGPVNDNFLPCMQGDSSALVRSQLQAEVARLEQLAELNHGVVLHLERRDCAIFGLRKFILVHSSEKERLLGRHLRDGMSLLQEEKLRKQLLAQVLMSRSWFDWGRGCWCRCTS